MTKINELLVKLLVTGLTCVVIYSLLGFMVVPYFAKRHLERQIAETYPVELKITELDTNPFTLSLGANEVELFESPGNTLVRIERVYVNLQAISIFRGEWNLLEIRVIQPRINFVLLDEGTTNFSWLTDQRNDDRAAIAVTIKSLAIEEGQIDIKNSAVTEALPQTLEEINVTATNLGTKAGDDGEYRFSFISGDKAQFSMEGAVNLSRKSISGVIGLTALPIAGISSWIPALNTLRPTGLVGIETEFDLSADTGNWQVSVDKSRLKIRNLGIQPVDTPGIETELVDLQFAGSFEPALGLDGISLRRIKTVLENLTIIEPETTSRMLAIKSLMGEEGKIDGGPGEISLGTVKVTGGEFNINRDEEGKIDWLEHVNRSGNNSTAPDNAASMPEREWAVRLARLETRDFNVTVDDQALLKPSVLRISEIGLVASGLELRGTGHAEFQVNAILNETGRISAEGWIVPLDGSLETKLDIQEIVLADFNSYVGQVSRLSVDTGNLDMQARLSRTASVLNVDANASIANLAMTTRDDDVQVIKSTKITAADISLTAFPLSGIIKLVELEKPYVNIGINAERQLNISEWIVVGDKDETKSTPAIPEPGHQSIDLFIEQVKIIEAAVDFTDDSLTPRLSTKMDSLNGAVSSLDLSGKRGPASLEMKGRVGKFGSVDINGSLTVSDPARQAELKMLLQNMDTAVLSPYSGRFAGRAINSGKLDLDLDYQIVNSQVTGQNGFVLKDFVLGERVDSPDALDIPLDMALALLKDKDGKIDISVPISGDLSDPKFDIRAVIGKAISNLMTKLVTAPFKALAGLFGGKSKELDTVPFTPGLAGITPPAAEVLESLAQALKERPALLLKINTGFDPKQDRDAIARKALRRKVLSETGATIDPAATTVPLVFADRKTHEVVARLAASEMEQDQLEKIRVKSALSPPESASAEDYEIMNEISFHKALFDELVRINEVDVMEMEALAESRAQNIRAELISLGIAADRISISKVTSAKKTDEKSVPVKLEISADTKRL